MRKLAVILTIVFLVSDAQLGFLLYKIDRYEAHMAEVTPVPTTTDHGTPGTPGAETASPELSPEATISVSPGGPIPANAPLPGLGNAPMVQAPKTDKPGMYQMADALVWAMSQDKVTLTDEQKDKLRDILMAAQDAEVANFDLEHTFSHILTLDQARYILRTVQPNTPAPKMSAIVDDLSKGAAKVSKKDANAPYPEGRSDDNSFIPYNLVLPGIPQLQKSQDMELTPKQANWLLRLFREWSANTEKMQKHAEEVNALLTESQRAAIKDRLEGRPPLSPLVLKHIWKFL